MTSWDLRMFDRFQRWVIRRGGGSSRISFWLWCWMLRAYLRRHPDSEFAIALRVLESQFRHVASVIRETFMPTLAQVVASMSTFAEAASRAEAEGRS